jgi:hypothetical protein
MRVILGIFFHHYPPRTRERWDDTLIATDRLYVRSSTWAQIPGYNNVFAWHLMAVWSLLPCFSIEYQPIITARNPLFPKEIIILLLPGQILDGH